jgi:hypothetical protein
LSYEESVERSSDRADMRGKFLGCSSKNIFQQQCLLEQYYDRKVKEFLELKLESMTMGSIREYFWKIMRQVDLI